ncbi:DUF4149 domain-containing protein [Roseateles terrae]|uniref:TMEM205-like domain-containing protein n=1 Tax=Roseateles terrae TaxID=431060 RepID=A0ABR6GL10_9BURK|nr:DUF4149 domain-containing protein [Roseateles terrae]MBB3192795.1 hypothetical protein [Roseateles terrae]OWQ89935.1 hypothetical protein CDN98_05435 [Roseateles terrae]
MLLRLRALLAALWAGELLTVAFLAAPNAFASLERAQAGLYVGRLFEMDARIALAAAVLLVLMERRLQRDGTSTGPVMGLPLVLPLVALFLTVLGYYGLQPLMESAKQGLGSWTFLQLHAVSLAMFGLRTVAVVVLAWRIMPRQ